MENIRLSIVKGIDKKILKVTTLSKVLSHIQHHHKGASRDLYTARTQDEAAYKALKAHLYGFLVGEWTSREVGCCTHYEPLLVFDVDGGNAYPTLQALKADFELFKEVPEVLFCFPSPSHCGLRIGIRANCTLENHDAVYGDALTYLSLFSDIPINGNKDGKHFDSSCRNPSRFFYFTPTNWVHVNENATVYQRQGFETRKKPQFCGNPSYTEPVDLNEIESLCDTVRDRQGLEFYKGYRKKFVYRYTKILYSHGVPPHRIENLLLPYAESGKGQDGFSAKEILRQIRFGIAKTHAFYNIKQLKKYING